MWLSPAYLVWLRGIIIKLYFPEVESKAAGEIWLKAEGHWNGKHQNKKRDSFVF